jgi:hypothetical protein
LFAHEPDRIDVEEQSSRASFRRCFRIEDVHPAERRPERLQARGVLVQQVAEIGGRLMRGCDRELQGGPP